MNIGSGWKNPFIVIRRTICGDKLKKLQKPIKVGNSISKDNYQTSPYSTALILLYTTKITTNNILWSELQQDHNNSTQATLLHNRYHLKEKLDISRVLEVNFLRQAPLLLPVKHSFLSWSRWTYRRRQRYPTSLVPGSPVPFLHLLHSIHTITSSCLHIQYINCNLILGSELAKYISY